MYKKEELITIHFLLEQMLRTHFSDRVKSFERDEVRQEILHKILSKKLRHSDTKGNMGQWLYRVIQNHLTDIYRIKRRSIVQSMGDLSNLSRMEEEEDHLKEELLSDRWSQYNHLLSKEKMLDQSIVRMRHEEGMSYEQIADKLALPKGPLAMRYKRAKARLKMEYRPNRILD
jgi:RNA polymerase sigma factor (sigma-70 family)